MFLDVLRPLACMLDHVERFCQTQKTQNLKTPSSPTNPCSLPVVCIHVASNLDQSLPPLFRTFFPMHTIRALMSSRLFRRILEPVFPETPKKAT